MIFIPPYCVSGTKGYSQFFLCEASKRSVSAYLFFLTLTPLSPIDSTSSSPFAQLRFGRETKWRRVRQRVVTSLGEGGPAGVYPRPPRGARMRFRLGAFTRVDRPDLRLQATRPTGLRSRQRLSSSFLRGQRRYRRDHGPSQEKRHHRFHQQLRSNSQATL